MALNFLLALWLAVSTPALRELGIFPLVRSPMSRWMVQQPLREPRIVSWFLPYQGWKAEYRQYFQWHVHDPNYLFPHGRPTMIVMHYTVTPNATSVWSGFAQGGPMDNGDYGFPFGHPSVHYMIDHDGTIFQLLPTNWRCTGAYGVNQEALSIEMVALNEDDLLSRPRQIYASFCLVASLMRQFHIPLKNVVGHNEVSYGRILVPQYLDYADSKWPYYYPPVAFRFDPGWTYMGWLRRRLSNRRHR
jgi:hypothetical protein